MHKFDRGDMPIHRNHQGISQDLNLHLLQCFRAYCLAISKDQLQRLTGPDPSPRTPISSLQASQRPPNLHALFHHAPCCDPISPSTKQSGSLVFENFCTPYDNARSIHEQTQRHVFREIPDRDAPAASCHAGGNVTSPPIMPDVQPAQAQCP